MRGALLIIVLSGALSAPALAAKADPQVVFSEIQSLTTEAVAAFDNYSYRKAQTKLEHALSLAGSAGLSRDPKLAEVHVMLGVAAVAGSNDLYRGLHAFVQAIRLNPAASIPKKVQTPQLLEMFARARQTAKEIGKPPTIRLAQSKASLAQQQARKKSTASGLVHSPVDFAKRGYPIPVKVETGIDIQAHKVILFYRTAGTVTYSAIPMQKSGNVFRAAVPPEATAGRYLHYYLEARDQRGRLAASFGAARSPSVIIVQ
jgi:hypothetical protein